MYKKSFNGKITQLPDSINPNKLIMEAMDEKYSICPFCGENRRVDFIKSDKGICKHNYTSWYGKKTDSFFSSFKFWEKDLHWRIDKWRCNTCGAKWESEPYPTDIMGGEVFNDISIYKIGD